MKKYLSPNFIVPFLWFCVMQPLIFFLCMAVFVTAIIQSILG